MNDEIKKLICESKGLTRKQAAKLYMEIVKLIDRDINKTN